MECECLGIYYKMEMKRSTRQKDRKMSSKKLKYIEDDDDILQGDEGYQITILDLPKDIFGYMMFNFLSPHNIKQCYRTHRSFWALSNIQKELTIKMCTTTFTNAIATNDMELFHHFFKVHNLKHNNPMCFRIDLALETCINELNIEAFNFIF